MAREVGTERQEGASTRSLTVGSLVSILALLASGVATYSVIQTDLTSLKRGEVYQEKVNEQMREDFKALRVEQKDARHEQRETMKEFNDKLDRLAQSLAAKRRD